MSENELPTVDPETGLVEGYIAEYGDWVRMADGTGAAVIAANAAYDNAADRPGCFYTLMFKGGEEKTYYHWKGDDFLTRASWANVKTTVPLFTVVSQGA